MSIRDIVRSIISFDEICESCLQNSKNVLLYNLMIMFILLFGKGIHARSVRMNEVAEQGYCTIVLSYCNFKPFVSIHSYIQNLTTMDIGDFSFKQIIGNTFMIWNVEPDFNTKMKIYAV